ncbi:MAG: hypothetical protein ACXVWW_02345 [Nocardioides sp.]
MTKRWGMGLVALGLLAPVLAACGHDPVAAPTPTPSASASAAPSYDPALPTAQAVLALVPHDATTLSITDFDQVRAQYGAEPGDPGFWQDATRHSPLLSTGMLRPYARQLHGFGPDDVAWEAHYSGADAASTGWVLAFGPHADMGAVQKAVAAGIGPLAGAEVDTTARVVTSSPLAPTDAGWTDLAALVTGPEAESTYVARGCLPGDTQGQRLEPLDAYAVSFGQSLATAYLGADRDDLFVRMRLGEGVAGFRAAFTHGAADPGTGRIGYTMTDPVDAAQQALRSKLPFAMCAD